MESIIKTIEPKGNWSNEHGTMYSFLYTFEDGTVITANHKTQTSPFQPGAKAEYEVKKEDPQYGKSGSVKKPEQAQYSGAKSSGGNDAVQLMIVRQSSLNRAVELLIHNASESKPVDEIECIELAERLAKWVMSPEKKAEPTPQPEAVKDAVQNGTIGEESDDLPF